MIEEYLKKYLKGDLKEGMKKLKRGIAPQYIIGDVNFLGYTIKVNPSVLIPRFETELLVQKTVNYINQYFNSKVDIIDLGTGSGAIAISLKKKLKCNVTAIDISTEALNVAKENARLNEVDIIFYENDMLEKIEDKYDVIISNPPYISYDENIDDIVKNNEPAIALFASNKGLEFYEKILEKATKNIKEKGIIAFEIGKTQGRKIEKIAKKHFAKAKIKIEKDYNDEDRFVFIIL